MYATPPGAVEIDDVAEAGGVDGLNSGAGRLRMRGRGLRVDSSREDRNAKANDQSHGAQNLAHPGPEGTRTNKTQFDPPGSLLYPVSHIAGRNGVASADHSLSKRKEARLIYMEVQ